MKNNKNEHRQKHCIFEGFRQNGLHHWIQRFNLHNLAPVIHIFRNFLLTIIFVDIRIIKNCIIWMFWRLERFFIGKSFRLHISKPKKIPGNIFFDISEVRKSTRRGLLGRQNFILSQKSVPQGAFGRIQLHFEPEKHPAGAFWGKYLISCESEVACKFLKKSQKALNHVLIG